MGLARGDLKNLSKRPTRPANSPDNQTNAPTTLSTKPDSAPRRPARQTSGQDAAPFGSHLPTAQPAFQP